MADTGTATTAAAGGIDGHAVAGRRGLTIREITLTPIVVPLDGVYRGSYYRGGHDCGRSHHCCRDHSGSHYRGRNHGGRDHLRCCYNERSFRCNP